MQYTCTQTRLRLRRHWLSGCPSCGSLVRKFIDRIQPSTKLFSNTIRIITLVINRSREPAFSFQLDLCHTMGLFHLLSPPSSIQNQFPSYYGPDLILISLHTLFSFQIFNLDIDQLRPNSHSQATRRVNNSSYFFARTSSCAGFRSHRLFRTMIPALSAEAFQKRSRT